MSICLAVSTEYGRIDRHLADGIVRAMHSIARSYIILNFYLIKYL